MESFKQSTENNEEPREIKSLKFFIDTARKTPSGERIFGDTSYDSLQKKLTAAEESGADVSSLKMEVDELLKEIPNAEMNNILKQSEGYLENGNIASAKSWHYAAEQSIKNWEQKSSVDAESISQFQKRADELHSKLYGNESAGLEDKPRISPEKINQYMGEIDSVLRLQADLVMRGYEDDVDSYKPWPVDEVKKFCESVVVFFDQKVKLYNRAGDFEKSSRVLGQIDTLKELFSELDGAQEVPEGFLQKTKELVEKNLKA